MSESDIQSRIRLEVGSLPDARIYRNNVGTLLDSRGIPVSFGLAVGSADLIGLVAPWGRFLSIEVKRPKHKTSKVRQEAQAAWRSIIARFGGVATQAETVDDAMAAVELARACPCCGKRE